MQRGDKEYNPAEVIIIIIVAITTLVSVGWVWTTVCDAIIDNHLKTQRCEAKGGQYLGLVSACVKTIPI